MKKLLIFDLDGTLAESQAALDDEMAAILERLLKVAKVAVISGGDWLQFEKQVLSRLSEKKRLKNFLYSLHAAPNTMNIMKAGNCFTLKISHRKKRLRLNKTW